MLVNIFIYRYEKDLNSEKNFWKLKDKNETRNYCVIRFFINKSEGEEY